MCRLGDRFIKSAGPVFIIYSTHGLDKLAGGRLMKLDGRHESGRRALRENLGR